MGNQVGRLPLSKLSFGKIDARNEILTRDNEVIRHFKESFLQPSGIPIREFRTGERFYIFGPKGAGKTAFLRFMQLEVQDEGCLTKFITFARDISDSERSRLEALGGIDVVRQDADPDQSAVNAWLMFIFREIVDLFESNKILFDADRDIRYLCDLVKKFYEGEKHGFLSWLFETAKRGKYKIKARYLEANLSGHTGDKEREVPLDVIVKQCFKLLEGLSWNTMHGIYLFFDELNLSFGSRDQHKRDAVLIRDLILAIGQVNEFFIAQQKRFFVLAAVRSEVLHAVSVPTHEINKLLADRGSELRWFSKTAAVQAPIVDLFIKKVNTSELIAKHSASKDVLTSYFRRNTFGMSPKDLIVELTWCNPRDLILLFGAAAQGGSNDLFDENLISKYVDKYSQDSWNEKAEELNVEYAPVEIQTLRKIFLDFKRYFRVIDFDIELDRKADLDQNIAAFAKKRSSSKVLEDLYRVGLLGQSQRRPNVSGTGLRQFEEHWAYRGDNSFNPASWMVVHKVLWRHLRLGDIWVNR